MIKRGRLHHFSARRDSPTILHLIIMFAMFVTSVLVPQTTLAQDRLCFDVPGISNCIDGRFLQFWRDYGGLAQFGYPIGPSVDEYNNDTRRAHLTQWFERGRFEFHFENPTPHDIQLGRLGADRLVALGRNWQTEGREPGPQPGCRWFEETGHNVCNQAGGQGFLALWSVPGDLLLYGLPLTTPRMELNRNGDNVLTQWFERARFEWHGEKGVLLGLLGKELYGGNAPNVPAPVPPPSPAPLGGDMLYPCTAGLCHINLSNGQWRVVVPLSFYREALYGYAKTSDGRIFYAVGEPRPYNESANVYVANIDGSNPFNVGRVSGIRNGAGGMEGYGVLGVTPDNAQLILEAGGQAITVRIEDGSYKPITPVMPAGASSSHMLLPSPSTSHLLLLSTVYRPSSTLYRVSDGIVSRHQLDPYLATAFWGRDESHFIAYRFDRPYDESASRGEMQMRKLVGYVEVNLANGQVQNLSIDPAFRPITTGANGHIVMMRGANEFALFNPTNNSLQPISLPSFSLEGDSKQMFRWVDCC